jgi:hypothetical protein
VAIARKDKSGIYGPGGRSVSTPTVSTSLAAAQKQPLSGPSTPVLPEPLMKTIHLYFHFRGEPPFPLPDGRSTVTFMRDQKIGDMNEWVRKQVKHHPEYLPGAKASKGVVIEDPDQDHKGWVALQKGHSKCTGVGFPCTPESTVESLFLYIDALLASSDIFKNSRIVFCFPVIECEFYPLDDPRNDVIPIQGDETDTSADEARSRSSRGRSLGVSHQLGRKRSKTPSTKGKGLRTVVKVPILDPFEPDYLPDREHELLSVYTWWRDEERRLYDEFGPLPALLPYPSSTQPPAPASDDGAVPIIKRKNSLSLFVPGVPRPSNAGNEGLDNGQDEGKAPRGKKRGKALAKSGGEKSGPATRKSSRSKGKATA